ncbi:MAG: glycerophosphodiester phosphodiesterase [Bellilinea sp.]
MAHHGARSVAPENTLAAARKAVEIGADMRELDVSVTADGELFLMHDDTLDCTCPLSGYIKYKMVIRWIVQE